MIKWLQCCFCLLSSHALQSYQLSAHNTDNSLNAFVNMLLPLLIKAILTFSISFLIIRQLNVLKSVFHFKVYI